MSNPFAADPHRLSELADDDETSGRKKCSTCERTLNAGNKSGRCTPCQKPGRYGLEAPKGERTPRLVKPAASAPVSQGGGSPVELNPNQALERFRVVANALELDADELLGGFAAKWLTELQAKAAAP